MADAGEFAPTTDSNAPAWRFITTFLILLASIAGLFVVDVALSRIDEREQKSHAADLYAVGAVLLRNGDPAGAADHFASAVAMERENHDYELAFAEAMLADNRVDEARATLTRLLSRAETDGAVNIAMARTLVRAGDSTAAKSYYHRAVYGRWRGDTAALRMRARMELVALLAKRGESRELLAELLPLEDMYKDSVAFRRDLARHLLRAHSPDRALAVYRSLTANNRRDASAWAGSGEASLAMGNFRDAVRDLDEAHRLAPRDERTTAFKMEADSGRAINPEERGLGAHGRLERARALLARAVTVLQRCDAGAATTADSAQIALGRSQLAAKVRPDAEEAAGNAIHRGGDCALVSASANLQGGRLTWRPGDGNRVRLRRTVTSSDEAGHRLENEHEAAELLRRIRQHEGLRGSLVRCRCVTDAETTQQGGHGRSLSHQ